MAGSRDAHPSSSGSAAPAFSPLTQTIACLSPFKRLHSADRTTFIEKRAALLSLTSCFYRRSRVPTSASTGTASNTPGLHAEAPAGCSHEQLRARHGSAEQEGTSSRPPRGAAGRQSPSAGGCGSAELGERLPRSLAAQPGQELGEQPRSRPPPGSPRSGTHRTGRALGSSSAPARRRPGRRRGREAP